MNGRIVDRLGGGLRPHGRNVHLVDGPVESKRAVGDKEIELQDIAVSHSYWQRGPTLPRGGR